MKQFPRICLLKQLNKLFKNEAAVQSQTRIIRERSNFEMKKDGFRALVQPTPGYTKNIIYSILAKTILLVFLLYSSKTNAQAPFQVWDMTNKTNNLGSVLESGSSITATSDGGFVMVGDRTPSGYSDLILVKVSAGGVRSWQNENASSFNAYRDYASRIIQASNGNLVVVGTSEVAGTRCHMPAYPQYGFNSYDLQVSKYNSQTGAFISTMCYGGIGYNDRGADIVELPNGDFVVVGSTDSDDGDLTNAGGKTFWVMRINSLYDIKTWSKTFGTVGGGASGVALLPDGNIVAVGASGTDAYICKINATDGSLIWEKTVSGNNTESFRRVAVDNGGNIYAVGTTNSTSGLTNSTNGGNDALVAKFDGSGNLAWAKAFGGPQADGGASVIIGNDGLPVLAGSSQAIGGNITEAKGSNDGWTFKLAADGSFLWGKSIGSGASEGAVEIVKTNSGDYVVAHSTNQMYNSGDVHCPEGYMWAVKLAKEDIPEPEAALLWLKADNYTGTANQEIYQWKDASGNGNNATSNYGGPKFIPNALNGYPVMRFAGSNLAVNNFVLPSCKTGVDVFVVMKKTTASYDNNQVILDAYNSNSQQGFRFWSKYKGAETGTSAGSYAACLEYSGQKNINSDEDGSFNNTCWHIAEASFDVTSAGDDAMLYVDGQKINSPSTPKTNFSSGLNMSNTGLTIGYSSSTNASNLNADVAEIIILPRSLAPEKKKKIRDYLNAKYFSGGGTTNFTALPTSNKASDNIADNLIWKHSYNTTVANQVIASVKDNCLDLGTRTDNVYVDATATLQEGTYMTMRRHYTIKTSLTPTGTKRVRIYYTNDDFTDMQSKYVGLTSASQLAVLKFNGTNGANEDGVFKSSEGTLTTIPSSQITTGTAFGANYLEFDVAGFSEFWIYAPNLSLPVTFNSFSAVIKNNQLFVNFSTSNESNCSHYLVQMSRDGVNFKTIATLNSKADGGNSEKELAYEFHKSMSDLLLFSPAVLLMLLGLFSKRRKGVLLYAAMFIVIGASIFISCRKMENSIDSTGKAKIFIRIAQVDNDGTVNYSKTITAVEE